MLGFFDSLCGCFSPDLRKNIIEYLSSANLNRQVIEEEKCSEQSEPQPSIYAQVKTKSYYFMKLKEEEDRPAESCISDEAEQDKNKTTLQPNYYPQNPQKTEAFYDNLYIKKFNALREILSNEIGSDYSKIYDSQDDLNLKIYCKPQIYKTRRLNAYRFSFDLFNIEDRKLRAKSYQQLSQEASAQHQPLLTSKAQELKTKDGLIINRRKYKKILVIQQHEFMVGQKCETLQQNNKSVTYNTLFSVKGDWKSSEYYNQGWVHLAGMKVSQQKGDEDQGTSLTQSQSKLHFEGYINVDLDITVNANMLKQPISKQIRVYVQKLVCSLTGCDAI